MTTSGPGHIKLACCILFALGAFYASSIAAAEEIVPELPPEQAGADLTELGNVCKNLCSSRTSPPAFWDCERETWRISGSW